MNTNNPAGRGWLVENAMWMLRLGQAIWLAKKGWSIIPVEPRGKKPDEETLGNTAVPHTWQDYAAVPALWTQVLGWFQNREINLGVLTGKVSGITVLDVDSQAALDMIRGLLPAEFPLRMVKTHRGWHLYFRYIGKFMTNQGAAVQGVDLRNDMGMAVLPFSVHESGTVYEWQFPWSPEFPLDLPEMPETLKAWCMEKFNLSPAVEDDITGASDDGFYDDEEDDDEDDYDFDDIEDEWNGDDDDGDEPYVVTAVMWDGKLMLEVDDFLNDLDQVPSELAQSAQRQVEAHGGLKEDEILVLEDTISLNALYAASKDEVDSTVEADPSTDDSGLTI